MGDETKVYVSVHELLKRDFGVSVVIKQNPEVSSVGASDVTIAKGNVKRLALVVINLSANTLYVRPDQAAATSAGVILNPSGGMLSVVYPDDLSLPSSEWHAIASGAASSIFVLSAEMV